MSLTQDALLTAYWPHGPIPQWSPPLKTEGLERILTRMREYQPLVFDDIFDDLDAAFEIHVGTDPTDVAALAERLHQTLTHLIKIAQSGLRREIPPDIACAIERATPLLEANRIANIREEFGSVRRLAWLTQDLVEQMLAARIIEDQQ